MDPATAPPPMAPGSWRDALPPSGPVVRAVSLMDFELRTAVATLVTAASTPGTLLRRRGHSHREAAEFFADMAREKDPARIFSPPPAGVSVHNRTSPPLAWAPAVSAVETLSFTSPYQPVYAAGRDDFLSHSRNMIGRAMHWRHEEPRPTIIVVHGFTGSPYWLNSNFFQLPWFYGHGCDVVLTVLPFHGRRADRGSPFDGAGFFGNGLATFSEAVLQSVCDLRVLIDYLHGTGVERIGVTGLSLGGYVTALMAEVEPRLHFAVPNSAVTDMAPLIDAWFPAGPVIRAGLRLGRIDPDAHRAALSLHSPLRFPSRLSVDRLFVVGGLADRLSPPEHSARLWQHWGRPRIHWFPGSHILHLRRAVYLREIGRFLRHTGFSPG